MSGSGPSVVTAVVLAGAAGALLPTGRAPALRRLDGKRERRADARPGRARVGPVSGGFLLVGPVLVGSALVGSVGVLPALLALLLGALGWRQVVRQAARREAARRRDALGELLSALVAELRSGADPRPAVLAAATGLAGLEPVVTAAIRPCGDVAAALAELARAPGGSTAGELAAVWRVGEVTGCGLAVPVARVLRGHRAQDRLRREVSAQLAGPTATAYLLSALPLVGIAMGTALGADPAGFLLGSAPGRVALAAGVALVCAGVAWTRRITAAATAGWVAERGDAR